MGLCWCMDEYFCIYGGGNGDGMQGGECGCEVFCEDF